MLARFTFSVTAPKYGEERWVFSQNNQCGNWKTFGVGDLYTFFICTYIYFIYDTDEEIIDFETYTVLHSLLHNIDICRERV